MVTSQSLMRGMACWYVRLYLLLPDPVDPRLELEPELPDDILEVEPELIEPADPFLLGEKP